MFPKCVQFAACVISRATYTCEFSDIRSINNVANLAEEVSAGGSRQKDEEEIGSSSVEDFKMYKQR